MTSKYTHTASLLISRLERLSADSHYAHRASGLRGSLLRFLEQVERSNQDGVLLPIPAHQVEETLALGFDILEKAAREVRPPRRWDQRGNSSLE
jgi:hypothetical protein